MSNNTYIKIVNEGYPCADRDLPSIGVSQEIAPLPDGCSVEVAASVLNAGNIIIYRDIFTREIQAAIHTPHRVYIQEVRSTIATFHPNYPMLMGITREGEIVDESELLGDSRYQIEIPQWMLDEADPEVAEAMGRIVMTLNGLDPDVIRDLPHYERFNIVCRNINPGMTDLFQYVQERIAETWGINIYPVSTPLTRNEVDYFYVEHLPKPGKEWVGKEEERVSVNVDVTEPKLDPDSLPRRGSILTGTQINLDSPPMADLTKGGQYGPGDTAAKHLDANNPHQYTDKDTGTM